MGFKAGLGSPRQNLFCLELKSQVSGEQTTGGHFPEASTAITDASHSEQPFK